MELLMLFEGIFLFGSVCFTWSKLANKTGIFFGCPGKKSNILLHCILAEKTIVHCFINLVQAVTSVSWQNFKSQHFLFIYTTFIKEFPLL
jgi:hypothetical protein